MDGHTLEQIRDADPSAHSAELVIDGQSLLIGHVHIHSVEPMEEVRRQSGLGNAIGTLTLADGEWPVYSVDGDLEPLADVPDRRRACVLLNSSHGGVGFLCDRVRVVGNDALTLVPLPGCMRRDEGLLESLAVMDGRVSCVLDAVRLSAMLRSTSGEDGLDASEAASGST